MTATHRRIILFFVVTYVLSWFGWLGNWIWPGLPIWPLPNNPFGPILAAPLVLWFTEGRAGLVAWLRRLGKFRAPVWIYGAALLVPLAIILGIAGFLMEYVAWTVGLGAMALMRFRRRSDGRTGVSGPTDDMATSSPSA